MANKTENLNTLQIHKLSQAQYDAALAAGKIDDTAIYLTPDEDNFASQEEFDAKVAEIEKNIGDISDALGGKASKDITINDQPLTDNITLTYTDVGAAQEGHNHDTTYYKKAEIDAKVDAIEAAYCTKGEINTALAGLSTTGHKHEGVYAEVATVDKINEDIKGINETIKGAGNWDSAYQHSTQDHAPSDAEKNTIVTIKVNDTSLIPDNDRAVKISMYTTEQIDAELDKKVDNTITINGQALTGNISLTYGDVGAADESAQENIIESIKVNGTALSITDKTVNIPVPTGALADKDAVAESDLDATLAAKIDGKADKKTTLAGYGITDAYTKEEVDADITTLETGDVQANKKAIAKLTGDDTTAGSLAKAVKDVTAYIDQEVDELAKGQVLTNKNAIGTVDNLSTTAKDLVSAINEVRSAVGAGGLAATISIDTSTTTDGALKSYTIKQGSGDTATTIGTIDIPKDMVVVNGTVEVNPAGQDDGTYIKLELANVEEPLYINVGTLVDIYTAQESATQVQITIDSSTREIGAAIVAESITATELAEDAVTTTKIANKNVTKAKLSEEVQTILGNVKTLSDQFGDFVDTTLPAHTDNVNIHVTAPQKVEWDTAYTHSTSAHARTDATKVEGSETNGNIKINDNETIVYAHPASGVTAGTYKSVTVDSEGHITAGTNPTTLQGYGITDTYTSEQVDAELDKKVDNTITINGQALTGNISLTYGDVGAADESAQENIIESIKVNGTALSITDKTVNIPVPTGALADKDAVAETDLENALAVKINNKADKTTTLAGYGITDAYTKDEVDGFLSNLEGTDDHEHTSGKITLTDVNEYLDEEDKIGETLNSGLLDIINRINAKADAAATTQALGLKASTSDLTELETALQTYIDQQVAAKSLVQIVTWENVNEDEESTEGAED